ncbi:alpha/beta fold hydrolase [Streptomyces chromofuscus]|uniref:Alpha/beta hydrolase n=1 Tax=Streptomyces chromofuscus TaxID=42881 RepID=A0A7M2TER4_STRCW|nr:alpha/beta hydrolase [Streptomyces chromofuscus]QOV47217.1 alpha/beta hydrolase [Streptomyces chromofuscus]GGT24233.1 alpha/beta hydrolase [Streptomyces chromofuscus]
MNLHARYRRARTPLTLIATAAVATGLFATSVGPASAAKTAASKADKPTVVLVHGAFADSSSWNGVIERLKEEGYPVVAAANPLRSLSKDAASVKDLLATIDGPVILVGHSYGGAVISNAAYGSDKVKALVYANGFAPDKGESANELASKFEGSVIGDVLRPVPITNPDGSKDVDLYIDQSKFHQAFGADVPAKTAGLMAVTQRPGTGTALNEPSGEPAWKAIPSWALVGTNDKIIPRELQVYMAERANAHIKEIDSSHAVTVSHPDAVTDIIEKAARTVR